MLEFRSLGTAALEQVRDDGATQVTLQPKRLGLFAWLLLARPRGVQRRDTVLALFWPEATTGRARNALSQALYGIREVVGEALETRGNEGLAVRTGAVQCDALAFEQALDEGLPADALTLYRGELLAGLYMHGAPGFERWLDAERRIFRRRARDAAVLLAEREQTAGNVVAAARWLEHGLDIAPMEETLVRRLIGLLDAAGDRAGSARTYEQFAEQLRVEYESEPAPETQAAIRAVRERRSAADPPARAETDRIPSLAVLPLDNLSARPDQDYIAEGMTETLITELAGLKNLRVISRQSSSAFRDVKRPLPEIARRLDVDLVVEGSVLHAGDRLRITVQLLRAEPEEHIWADTFDGPIHEVLELQRTVARAIAREVTRRFRQPVLAPAGRAGLVDPRAYEEFLRGIVRFPYTTPGTFDEVMGYFERAAAIDHTFGDAHAWIAFAWINATYVGACPLEVARAKALPRIERTLEVAPDIGSTHAAHATALFAFDRDWAASDAAWQRAERIGGGDPHSYAAYGLLLTGLGRFDEALARAQEGVRYNPLGAPEQFLVGYIHFRARRFDRAVEQLAWTHAQWPDYPWTAGILAASQLFAGWPTDAVDTCRRALRRANIPTSLAFLAATLGRNGQLAEARAVVQQLDAIDRRGYLDPCPLAVAWAGIGDEDRALTALERLVTEGSVQSWSVSVEVFFDPLRRRDRFRRILDALGLSTIPGSVQG